MNQENPSAGDLPVGSETPGHPASQPDQAPDRLALLQQAFLLEQLALEGAGIKTASEMNKKITAAAERELHLNAKVANRARQELADQGYLERTKDGRKVTYGLTASGQAYLARLERPTLSGRTKRPGSVDETAISDELREAQKAYLLLQLLDAGDQPLPRGDANKIQRNLSVSLGLRPAVANHRRAKLAEQNYIRITRTGRGEQYSLTPDGLDYLTAGARHLEHASITLKGKTLNALVGAARESPFDRDRAAGPSTAAQPVPSSSELAEAVLAEFQELHREHHGRSGLVPIHEVRRRITDRFGPPAGRHDVLDQVILGLWRENRLGIEAISDLGHATKEQLNDGIPGHNGTLFYLEVPREQPVASESL